LPPVVEDRAMLLGAATMLPVAIVVLGTLVVVASQTQILQDLSRAGIALRLAALAGSRCSCWRTSARSS